MRPMRRQAMTNEKRHKVRCPPYGRTAETEKQRQTLGISTDRNRPAGPTILACPCNRKFPWPCVILACRSEGLLAALSELPAPGYNGLVWIVVDIATGFAMHIYQKLGLLNHQTNVYSPFWTLRRSSEACVFYPGVRSLVRLTKQKSPSRA
jgi:hypothetical protein